MSFGKPVGIAAIKRRVVPVLRRHGVVRAGVFGSYARGEAGKGSDVDILVKIKSRKMSLLGFVRLGRELEEASGRKVDLVEYDALKPLIRDRILEEEIRIL